MKKEQIFEIINKMLGNELDRKEKVKRILSNLKIEGKSWRDFCGQYEAIQDELEYVYETLTDMYDTAVVDFEKSYLEKKENELIDEMDTDWMYYPWENEITIRMEQERDKINKKWDEINEVLKEIKEEYITNGREQTKEDIISLVRELTKKESKMPLKMPYNSRKASNCREAYKDYYYREIWKFFENEKVPIINSKESLLSWVYKSKDVYNDDNKGFIASEVLECVDSELLKDEEVVEKILKSWIMPIDEIENGIRNINDVKIQKVNWKEEKELLIEKYDPFSYEEFNDVKIEKVNCKLLVEKYDPVIYEHSNSYEEFLEKLSPQMIQKYIDIIMQRIPYNIIDNIESFNKKFGTNIQYADFPRHAKIVNWLHYYRDKNIEEYVSQEELLDSWELYDILKNFPETMENNEKLVVNYFEKTDKNGHTWKRNAVTVSKAYGKLGLNIPEKLFNNHYVGYRQKSDCYDWKEEYFEDPDYNEFMNVGGILDENSNIIKEKFDRYPLICRIKFLDENNMLNDIEKYINIDEIISSIEGEEEYEKDYHHCYNMELSYKFLFDVFDNYVDKIPEDLILKLYSKVLEKSEEFKEISLNSIIKAHLSKKMDVPNEIINELKTRGYSDEDIKSLIHGIMEEINYEQEKTKRINMSKLVDNAIEDDLRATEVVDGSNKLYIDEQTHHEGFSEDENK